MYKSCLLTCIEHPDTSGVDTELVSGPARVWISIHFSKYFIGELTKLIKFIDYLVPFSLANFDPESHQSVTCKTNERSW